MLQAVLQRSAELEAAPDVFDAPEGPASQLFVSPWSCSNVSPLDWELLQQVCAALSAATVSVQASHVRHAGGCKASR